MVIEFYVEHLIRIKCWINKNVLVSLIYVFIDPVSILIETTPINTISLDIIFVFIGVPTQNNISVINRLLSTQVPGCGTRKEEM